MPAASYAAPAPYKKNKMYRGYKAPAPAVSSAASAPEGNYIAPAPADYAVPAPVADHAPAPAVHAVPAPGVEYIAPAPAVPDVPSPVVEYITPARAMRGLTPVVEYIAPAPAVKRLSPVAAPVVEYIAPSPAVSRPSPVVEYIAPAPAVPGLAPVVDNTAPAPAPAPVAEYVEPAPVCRPTPVVENIAPVPTSTPAVSSSPALSGQSRQSAHRGSTVVPTVSSRHHDEWLRAERVLRARAARQGYLFRQMKRRDTQLAAQLTSLGKACDVARGSPAVSLLVSVASREQGLSAKLLAFDKQLEDHEVAVLELEKQVQVLEEEKEKMVLRMVQMEEQLSEEVLCLNVGLSQTGTDLRVVENKLWKLTDRVTALDEAVLNESRDTGLKFQEVVRKLDFFTERITNLEQCGDKLELSARVERLQKWSLNISAEFGVCQDRVTNLEQWGEELASSL